MQPQGDDVQGLVLNALHWDFAIPRHRLSVEVKDGWVTMSGLVDRAYQKSCAESDVRSVPGVVGVINHIKIAAPELDEAQTSLH